MLFYANVPLHLWVEAFSTTVFTINRLPALVLNGVSPFEILYGKSLTYALFHIFGCLCFPYLKIILNTSLNLEASHVFFLVTIHLIKDFDA